MPAASREIPRVELRRLATREDIDREAERLYDRLDHAEHRLVGELVDRQIKILRLRSERIDRDDLRADIARLIDSNRELSTRLAGGTHGAAITRADAAPPFSPPLSERTH